VDDAGTPVRIPTRRAFINAALPLFELLKSWDCDGQPALDAARTKVALAVEGVLDVFDSYRGAQSDAAEESCGRA
jgi:hypothetical protein